MKPLFFSSHDNDSDVAKKILKEAKIDFIEILANDVDEPTLIVDSSAYSYKGLKEIREYVDLR